jgi:hypothetical protein
MMDTSPRPRSAQPAGGDGITPLGLAFGPGPLDEQARLALGCFAARGGEKDDPRPWAGGRQVWCGRAKARS